MRPNVCFIGGLGSGKTTMAEALEKLGYTRLSLASPVKAKAAELLGRPIDKGTDRGFLQKVGAAGRAISLNYWVDALLSRLADDQQCHGPWVVDDCRFPNEAEALKAHGFTVVLVDTPTDVRIQRAKARDGKFDPKWLEDPSETNWRFIAHQESVNGLGDAAWEVATLLQRLTGQVDAA